MCFGHHYKTNSPHRECYSYAISTNQWMRRDELRLPLSMMPYEAHGFIQFNYKIQMSILLVG